MEQMQRWLSAWEEGPTYPSENVTSDTGVRAGGGAGNNQERRRSLQAKPVPGERLVNPAAIGKGREHVHAEMATKKLQLPHADMVGWLDGIGVQAVMARLANNTRLGYSLGWKVAVVASGTMQESVLEKSEQ